MASERLCNPAEGVGSAAQTVKCLEGIIAIASVFSDLNPSYIAVHKMEVQV